MSCRSQDVKRCDAAAESPSSGREALISETLEVTSDWGPAIPGRAAAQPFVTAKPQIMAQPDVGRILLPQFAEQK
jgi:hypothetical protein